ncbi:MAG: mechanosensitive ion channel, partial [Pseudomonas sp.]|nr:mechanosensitive ion channel [Pseudomonas sp.]
QQLSGDLRQTIDDQLFWVASNRRIDRAWLMTFGEQAQQQFKNMELLTQAKHAFVTLEEKWPWLLVLAALVALHTGYRKRIKQKLFTLNEDVGHFRRDTVYHTPKAIALSALKVLPVPVVLAALGLLLSRSDEAGMPVIGAALIKLSIAWFILHLLYRVLDPKGIAVRHFRWEANLVHRLHRLTRNLAWIMLPVVLIISLNAEIPEQQTNDVVGRFMMMAGMLLLCVLLGRMMWRSEPLYNSRVLHFTAMLVLTLTPLALAGMTYWGYHYTSTKLADRFIDTLYLIVLWMLLEGTVVRNLSVAGRRLAYQRAMAKREAAQNREGQENEAGIEIPEMDIQQINQQSLRLTKLGILMLFGVLVYFVWADLISAAYYLESITLWEYSGGTPENPTTTAMTAGDVLGALLIIAFTVTLARNLPGLLEILILSRMRLEQGSSYAITTLMSYIIVSIGIISGLSALGVSWDKLQWLVAALSVGLGFGLQEIFANFVSGLIILFEKPIRIGDVVTIGELSGTVNRIRIRATTITDFDRKEIIVPNKTFVTDQLINWSLSDTITRVIIKVGVAYGSDLAKTKELLLQAANNNPRVLKEPDAPLVLFLSFGDSTLDHELRIHVRELIDRNMAIDEINREIDRLFEENGIEIAFRQLDVNLRTSEGVDKLISSRLLDQKPPEPDAPQPDSPASL